MGNPYGSRLSRSAMLMSGCLLSACGNPNSKEEYKADSSLYPAVSIADAAKLFEASPPVLKASGWSYVSHESGTSRFEQRVRFEGTNEILISIALNTTGRHGQREAYAEIREARDQGRLTPARPTAFGLTVLDGGPNVFRHYLIGSQDTNFFCTYEGVRAPYPFVRCHWSDGPAVYLLETSPTAIHYALSKRSEIEQLAEPHGPAEADNIVRLPKAALVLDRRQQFCSWEHHNDPRLQLANVRWVRAAGDGCTQLTHARVAY
jgi:hypothetical protein